MIRVKLVSDRQEHDVVLPAIPRVGELVQSPEFFFELVPVMAVEYYCVHPAPQPDAHKGQWGVVVRLDV